ncbi:MAG: 3-phosphoshikimate 1-carboxyvinyltransferase [Candidatus Bathyarchaeota archaeon]
MTRAVVEATQMLQGEVAAPPSKSYTHRAIIASSLSKGLSHIKFPLYSEDIFSTIKACMSFGVSITQDTGELCVIGSTILTAPSSVLNCGDSASTLRFLIPVAALANGKTVLDGNVGLRKRPIGPLVKALESLGVKCSSSQGFPPVTVAGRSFRGGKVSMVGDVSSQFVTGLLFASPLAEEDTEITLTTPLESKPYIELTLDVLRDHGIKTDASPNYRRFRIFGQQQYVPQDHLVPGDFSSAAFLLAAGAMLVSDITVCNLFLNQPDDEIIRILSKMGASITLTNSSVRVRGRKLKGIEIDAKDIPDLVPVCAALGCVSEGTTHIFGAKRLRLKESNRLTTLSSELSKMGANIVETSEGLTITGPCKLRGATIIPHNDHRIAMACTIAGLNAVGKTEILEAECVNKSYPNFFEDLKILGANLYVR